MKTILTIAVTLFLSAILTAPQQFMLSFVVLWVYIGYLVLKIIHTHDTDDLDNFNYFDESKPAIILTTLFGPAILIAFVFCAIMDKGHERQTLENMYSNKIKWLWCIKLRNPFYWKEE